MFTSAELPHFEAWVNPEKARYYQVYLEQDLFGDWCLRKVWGGVHSHRGRMHNTGVSSYEAGLDRVREIAKRRAARGYQRVGGCSSSGVGVATCKHPRSDLQTSRFSAQIN